MQGSFSPYERKVDFHGATCYLFVVEVAGMGAEIKGLQMKIGEKIKKLRKARKWSQAKLAENICNIKMLLSTLFCGFEPSIRRDYLNYRVYYLK